MAAASAYFTLEKERKHLLSIPKVGTVRLVVSSVLLLLTMAIWGFFMGGELEAREVVSASMAPTIAVGDRVLTVAAVEGDVERGDIVVVAARPDDNTPLVKRVAGIPGDDVYVFNESVYVNEKPTMGQLTMSGALPIRYFHHYKLDPEEYFVLGDNRQGSYDSVWFGPIPRKEILAKAVFRYAPFNKMGFLQ